MTATKDDGSTEAVTPRPWRPLTVMHRGRTVEIHLETVDAQGHELDSPAAHAWRMMVLAARADGITLTINTAWRSREYQQRLRDRYEAYLRDFDAWQRTGEFEQPPRAVPLAARPGLSLHEIGRAVDVIRNPVIDAWLDARCGEFGWRKDVPSEPWHLSWHGR